MTTGNRPIRRPAAIVHRTCHDIGARCSRTYRKVTSQDADLMLFDGRMLAQNGWFVLRSILPPGKTGKVLTWTVEPNAIKDWIREPNIGFSQVGYLPHSPKKLS